MEHRPLNSDEYAEDEQQEKGPGTASSPWPSRIMGGALFIWIILVTATVQSVSWVSQQLARQGAGGGLTDADFVATVVQAALLLLPLTPVALVWKEPRYRLIFRLWFFAALFNLFAAVVHVPGATAAYTSAALQIVVALVFIVVFFVLGPAAGFTTAPTVGGASPAAIALAVSPFLLLPWAASGALGGPLEVALNLAAALLFGLCGGLLLRRLPEIGRRGARLDNRLRLLGGFVAGATLVPMAAAYGFGGNQLLLLVAVPATAWIATSLVGRARNTIALAIVIGLSTAGPLLFVDPREMALGISFGLFSTLGVAFRAAAISFFVAWIAGALLLVWRWLGRNKRQLEERPARGAVWGPLFIAAPAWLALALVYLFAGHPGFYGDRLFVIMHEQADVSSAEELDNVAQRRAFVYETLVEHAEATQGALRRDLSQFGFTFTPYYLVNGVEVEGGPLLRLWLESRPDVARVLYSPILRPAPPEGSEPLGTPAPQTTPWNLTLIRADAVWEEFGARGAGIVVGQSDSGVQWDHPQLVEGYRGSEGEHDYNWFDPWYGTREPTDTGGHGTHTLGTVLGESTGVAPEAAWFGCANLARNVGSTAYYLDCMQFMLAPFPLGGDPFHDGDAARGANVLNNSWGCPELEGCDDTSLLPAVSALRHAGTFVVVSAGNEGPDCSSLNSPPAIYDQVLSVGAVDRFRNVTSFSSRGPVVLDGSNRTKPDVVAPGMDILSAYPGNGYRTWQGTSMAGPHVAGVVALMWSANPQLIGDVATTEEILLATAQPLENSATACDATATAPNNTYGYGIVDAFAAVERAISGEN